MKLNSIAPQPYWSAYVYNRVKNIENELIDKIFDIIFNSFYEKTRVIIKKINKSENPRSVIESLNGRCIWIKHGGLVLTYFP